MIPIPAGDLGPALQILGGAPPAWTGDADAARDGLAWLVALPGPPRRELLADAWPRRVPVQISAACVEPSWGSGAARDPLALASAEAILLGWWCQAETVLVTRRFLDEAWEEAQERAGADPGQLDDELPPAICFVPAAETGSGAVPAAATLDGGPPDHLLAVLLVRDRPSLRAWDADVAGLFGQAAPGWPGRLSPRVWAAALWSHQGRLTRSAGPVQGWDGDGWRVEEESPALRPGGPARTASRLALSLVATIADDPSRVRDVVAGDGTAARLAA
ncbi:MAG: hypothetical protein AB1416_08085 [Actinomycetota bacterium]